MTLFALLVLLTTGPVSAPAAEPVEDVWHVEAAAVEAPAEPAPTPRAPSAAPAQPSYTVFFTSYNPVSAQTDASPCTGASGKDQCALAQDGVRIIALSQDLVGRSPKKPFHYGDRVWIASDGDARCNGEFVVLDTMNARYTMRGDLFFMDRSQNTSCTGTVSLLSE